MSCGTYPGCCARNCPRIWKVGLLIVILISPRVATSQRQVDRSEVFQLKDLDATESLDKEEFSGGAIGKMRERSDAEFERKDLNADGELSLDEFVAAAKWTEEERRELRREDFTQEDSDGDGEITKEQFIGGKTGIRKQYAEDTFAALDLNKDDALTESEYVDRGNLWAIPRIKFQGIDVNRDGELSMDEYIARDLGKTWEGNRRTLFSDFDADGNRVLEIEEYEKLESESSRKRAVGKLPKEEQLLATHDENGDRRVDRMEFQKVMVSEGRKVDSAEMLFKLLDVDRNESLDQREINRLNDKDPAIEFAVRDIDGSGTLTLAEQIGATRGKSTEKWRRLHFEVRDFDADGVLSPGEYAMSDDDRRVIFIKRDTNQDGIITLQEQLAGAVGTKHESWRRYNFLGHDSNRDGVASREEFVRSNDDPEVDFSRRDSDGDGLITLEEHLERTRGKPAENSNRRFFRSHDFDRSGTLTFDEFGVSKDDLRVKFGQKDEDANGSLSEEEFVAHAVGKTWEPKARRTFLLHDQDEDGLLSMDEFASTDEEAAEEKRIRNLPPDERGFARLDDSRDGSLSKEEFASRHGESTFVSDHEMNFFRALDFDLNGSLDLNEFLSKDEPVPQVVFAKRDTDGSKTLSFGEYAAWIPAESRSSEQGVFNDYDANADGMLSRDEFLRLEGGRPGRERWGWFLGLVWSPVNWVTGLIVLFDIALVFVVVRSVMRRLLGRSGSSTANRAVSET